MPRMPKKKMPPKAKPAKTKRRACGPDIGRVFMDGHGQAVTIPKAFRLPGNRVRIRREGQNLVLEPLEAPGQMRSRSLEVFRAEAERLLGSPPLQPEERAERPPMPEEEENLWDRYWP